jgi:hypothetical protein
MGYASVGREDGGGRTPTEQWGLKKSAPHKCFEVAYAYYQYLVLQLLLTVTQTNKVRF